MNTITINGQTLPYPKSLELKKIPNIVGEIETMTGKRIADVNGWRYADTTIEWGTLYPEDLNRLVTATSAPSFTIRFMDEHGTNQTVNAVLRGYSKARTLVKYGGQYVWEKVGITVSFPDCYNY